MRPLPSLPLLAIPRFKRALWLVSLLTLLCGAATLASAQEQKAWRFKYFAGDPPTWKDQPGSWGNKADCEIARAEKTTAGYPVGDCYALPSVTSSARPAQKPASSVDASGKIKPAPNPGASSAQTGKGSASSSSSSGKIKQGEGSGSKMVTAAELERQRQVKLREGCLVQCNATERACLSAVPEIQACIQAHNSDCIESCTRVEQLPHHQCINEVCLPNEVNLATWQGACESARNAAEQRCKSEHGTCEQACR